MFNFIVRRLAMLPIVLLVLIAVIVGFGQLLTPEQRASAYIRNEQQARNMARIIRDRGLDQPFHVQYGIWIQKALQGDLGVSKASGRDVLETFKERFPATVELTLLASIMIIGVSIWIGTQSALLKDKLFDQVARVVTIIGGTVPVFVTGVLLLQIMYGFLGWFPGPGQVSAENIIQLTIGAVPTRTGMLTVDALLAGNIPIFLDALWHMILPAITLALILGTTLIKATRASMLDVIKQDYVRTARSKGLPDSVVNLKHARRNALMPIVTLAGDLIFVQLLQGAFFTETVYARKGIGAWIGEAATQLDFGGMLGSAFFVGMIVVIGNLITDMMYTFVDPRVRFE
jgi:ABC-type dipeptide/oligopeptide/nickel transport system permease component